MEHRSLLSSHQDSSKSEDLPNTKCTRAQGQMRKRSGALQALRFKRRGIHRPDSTLESRAEQTGDHPVFVVKAIIITKAYIYAACLQLWMSRVGANQSS